MYLLTFASQENKEEKKISLASFIQYLSQINDLKYQCKIASRVLKIFGLLYL